MNHFQVPNILKSLYNYLKILLKIELQVNNRIFYTIFKRVNKKYADPAILTSDRS